MMRNLVQNIITLRKKKGFNQQVIADAIDRDVSNWSKVEQGKQSVQVDDLEKIANCLDVRVIDLFTYPDRYIKADDIGVGERISVTFEVSPDKRDILLSLVTKK